MTRIQAYTKLTNEVLNRVKLGLIFGARDHIKYKVLVHKAVVTAENLFRVMFYVLLTNLIQI